MSPTTTETSNTSTLVKDCPTKEVIMKKILDFMAAICLVFNVDWDKDFEDDEYVIACRENE